MTSAPEADGDPRAGYAARAALRQLSGLIGAVVLIGGIAVLHDLVSGAYAATSITRPFYAAFGIPGVVGFAAVGAVGGLAILTGLATRTRLALRLGLAAAAAWFVADSGIVVYGLMISHTVSFPAVAWCGWGLIVATLAGLAGGER